jgi:hypothetical protein
MERLFIVAVNPRIGMPTNASYICGYVDELLRQEGFRNSDDGYFMYGMANYVKDGIDGYTESILLRVKNNGGDWKSMLKSQDMKLVSEREVVQIADNHIIKYESGGAIEQFVEYMSSCNELVVFDDGQCYGVDESYIDENTLLVPVLYYPVFDYNTEYGGYVNIYGVGDNDEEIVKQVELPLFNKYKSLIEHVEISRHDQFLKQYNCKYIFKCNIMVRAVSTMYMSGEEFSNVRIKSVSIPNDKSSI